MTKINSIYIPFVVNNPYALNVRRILETANIKCWSVKQALKNPFRIFKVQVANLNWFEVVNSRIEFVIKCLFLLVLKVFRIKIVYTVHNKKPHNMTNNRLSIALMRKTMEMSDVILGLCNDTELVVKNISPQSLPKLKIVFHPNYIYNYRNSKAVCLRDFYGLRNDNIVFLFLGFLSPYKNIEMLIKAFKSLNNSNARLLIAGQAMSKEYEKQLIDLSQDCPNIIYDFRYIPDEEIPNYYKTSDIVILPYKKDSSLNSGAILLSLSMHKTVISPSIGTINSFKNKSFLYHYDYTDDREHLKKIKELVNKVCMDVQVDCSLLERKGEDGFRYVESIFSDEKLSLLYRDIYDNILNM